MMDKVPDPEMIQQVLGYHLGLLDEDERVRVGARFERPDELDAACRVVEKRLAPLDSYVIAQPSPGLIRRILAEVSEEPRVVSFPSANAIAQAEEQHTGRGPAVSLREIVGLAAAILMFVGVFVPGYRTTMNASRQAACANNLRLVGNGYANYAEANGSFYPFAGLTPGAGDWNSANAVVNHPLRNSRHAYRLVAGRFVPAYAFRCLGAEGDYVFDPENPSDYQDFPDARNISYSTDLMRNPWHTGNFMGNRPLMADTTPLYDSRRFLIRGQVIQPNSRNHGGRTGGQNVLYGNMSVRFYLTPLVGINNDDIYRVKDVDFYTGDENPSRDDDTFLVP